MSQSSAVNRNQTASLLIPLICLGLGVMVGVTYLAGWNGPLAKVLVCLWLFCVPGAGLSLWMRREMLLQVFMGLSIALSCTLNAFVAWTWAFTGWPLSSAFWVIWWVSNFCLAGCVWRVWNRGALSKIAVHRSSWVVLLLVLIIAVLSGVQGVAGRSADIFPATAVSSQTWAANHVVRESPFVGGPTANNDHFRTILALAAHVADTDPLDMFDVERTLFAALLGFMFSSLPCLMGFRPWSSVGTLLYIVILLPDHVIGLRVLQYQSWALIICWTGLLLIISYLREGRTNKGY